MQRRGLLGWLGATVAAAPSAVQGLPGRALGTVSTRYVLPTEDPASVPIEAPTVGDTHGVTKLGFPRKVAQTLFKDATKQAAARRHRHEYSGALLGGEHPQVYSTRSWAPWYKAHVSARKWQAEQAAHQGWMSKMAAHWWGEDDWDRPA